MDWNIFKFRKKKKKEEEPDPIFSKQIENVDSKRSISLPSINLSNPFSKKFRIGILLKLKRFLAVLLLIVHVITGFMAIERPAALLFLLTGFILLDYLWKTRKKNLSVMRS